MAHRTPHAGTSTRGFTIFEMVLGVFLVFALLLGVLIVITSEGSGTEKDYGVSPYRAMYAGYINNRLKEWTNAILSYQNMNGALPGDSSSSPFTNSSGGTIGDNNGRVEKDKEENVKFFRDLFDAGLASEPRVRVRNRVMDFYWADLSRNHTRGAAGNYFKLPCIHRDEALALDQKFDDGSRTSGSVLYFDNPDGTVDLFVLFSPF